MAIQDSFLSRASAALVAGAAGLLVASMFFGSVDPTYAAKGGKGGGGDETPASDKTPSIITYRSEAGDGILSDDDLVFDDVYNHGNGTQDIDQLRVFIGDSGGTGNIYMQFGPDHLYPNGGSHDRSLRVDFSEPDTSYGVPEAACATLLNDLSPTPILITPHYHNLGVNNSIQEGVFGLTEGGAAVSSEMKIRFFDPTSLNMADGDAYSLSFDSVWVRRTAVDEWVVDIHNDANDRASLVKAKGKGGVKAAFCGSYHLPAQFTLKACAPTDNCPPMP